ncbi:MAG: hypothetical protein J6F32_00385, partial [Pseudomonas sp.]|nr:hypothetical protein [Pseudomonas sp.]
MNKPHAIAASRALRVATLLFTLACVCVQARAQEPQARLQSLLELSTAVPATRLPTIKAWKLSQNT